MLKHLHISQYALIEELDMDLVSGFSVITGETGAGKSIIMGALGLIMGVRADSKSVRNGAAKCVVEAVFDLKGGTNLSELFESLNLDYEDECVIRREVTAAGKSRAFINDTPVNQQQMRNITSRLIDIHSQHENLLLNDSDFQLRILDNIAGSETILKEYKIIYNTYNQKFKELETLKQIAQQSKSDEDYAKFQFEQLQSASLKENEQKELEVELDILNHTEDLKRDFNMMNNRMDDEQYGIIMQMNDVLQAISRSSKYYKDAEDVESRISSLYVELKDIAENIASMSSNLEFDPQRKIYVEERLNEIYTLEQKHRVNTVKELLDIKNGYEEKLLRIDSFDEEILSLQRDVDETYNRLLIFGEKLTALRMKVKNKISEYLIEKLVYLGMPNAKIEVSLSKSENYTPNGNDNVCFLFSANKNSQLRPISSIASGGEISRVMLAMKSMLAKKSDLRTIIFDEIDTGVSGEVAGRMGELMSMMSEDMQVVAITHLPQIAAKGNTHFKVFKQDKEDKTLTYIVSLSSNERELEIAEMLSGRNPSETAILAARELLNS